jgi:DNA-binding XRE family transcriptional regulator
MGGDIMNVNDLNAEIARCGLTIPKLAELIGLDKKTLYSRMKGETSFKQPEIVVISKVLNLTSEKILNIFFADSVS